MTKYCSYIFKKGTKKGENCKEPKHLNTTFCKKHLNKYIDKDKYSDNSDKNSYTYNTNDSNVKNKKDRITNQKKEIPKIYINKIINKKLQEDSIREKILDLQTNDTNKSVIFKHYNNMKRTDSNSTEYYKNQIFVDTSLSYPWSKSYNINDYVKGDIKHFLETIKKNLDKEIFGMDSVKNEILNVVCKFITNPTSCRNNIALYGSAGIGKSKFIKVLSDTLKIPMKVISLGGVKDSSFFLGHGYVYVESGPGKILQNIIDSKINNPILYFDELDKVSETDNGKDIFSFLCYLTDPTQNNRFTDHYFYGMEFDLSKAFYVFTFNDITKIDKILLDRLNIIQVNTPNQTDIINILQKYCIPEILQNIGIQIQVSFSNESIKYIIDFYRDSIDKSITSGIREYYRVIEKILLELNKQILLNNLQFNKPTLTIEKDTFTNLFNNIKEQLHQKNNLSSSLHMYI